MRTNRLTSTVIVWPMALIAGVARKTTMRGAARALPAMLWLSWPLAAAHAQTPCATTGTNQTCTNSVTISGGGGISDTATLNLTNTATGAIRGTAFGVVADGTANVTNFGTIEATGANGVGIFANTVANVTNYGDIRATGANGIGIAADTANVMNLNMIQASARGISANVANVTNFGIIQATGGNGIGIGANTVANVTNYGVVQATGVDGIGIAANTVANVTNFGTIQATGAAGFGISSDVANVTNYGVIRATGAIGNGIDVITANVWNSGTIAASNFGILAGAANVTNFGTIEATGVNGVAIAAETGASVINRGTIQAMGASGTGIDVIGAANVVNAGTISGQRAALDFSSAADTLTLLPGSRIIGAILLRGGGDTVNFRGGNHNLTFDTLTGATVSGTTPFAVSDNRAAAVDPTSFAAGWRSLADFTRGVSDAVPVFSGGTSGGGAPLAFTGPESSSRIDDAFAAVPGLASAYAGEAMAFKAPTATLADGTTVWARGFAGQRIQQQDGVLLRNTNFFYGGMMGADFAFRPDLRVGGFLGGGQTRSRIELNQGGSDSDLLFGGAYARYDIGASFVHGAVQGGSSRNSTTRTINNNLVANGLEIANASYNGWYVSPELTLGHRFGLGRLADATYTLTPSMRVRYLYGAFDGYTETGTTAPLTIGGQTVSVLEERGELKLTRTVAFDPANQLSTSLAGGVLGTQRTGNTINAALLGQTIPFATPGTADVWGGFAGLGLEWRTRNVTFYSAAEYLALSDNSGVVSGRAGLRVGF